MAGKIKIDFERCKGCGLCVIACPKGGIVISKKSNKNGFFSAEDACTDCTGCSACAIVCPEAVIEVSRGSEIKEIAAEKAGSKNIHSKAVRK